jgi:hypothetical protein
MHGNEIRLMYHIDNKKNKSDRKMKYLFWSGKKYSEVLILGNEMSQIACTFRLTEIKRKPRPQHSLLIS